MWLIFSLTYSMSCAPEPVVMPTEALVAEKQRTPSAAYQLLYNSQALPEAPLVQQRVRILAWLHRMNLSDSQLTMLQNIRATVIERQQQLLQLEKQESTTQAELETPIYNAIWDLMRKGHRLDSDALKPALSDLESVQNGQRKNILERRIAGITGIMDAQQSFLQNLSQEQEATVVDALFFLRHRLDPIGTPGRFELLVGSTYEPGQYAILSKGTTELADIPQNIGGLWSDEPELTGRVLHEARREAILYLLLLEPALDEAILAAKQAKQARQQLNPSAEPSPESP